MEGRQLSAAGVFSPLQEGIVDDQYGGRDEDLVEENCADSLTQLHGVYLPEDRRNREGHMRDKFPPDLLRVGFCE